MTKSYFSRVVVFPAIFILISLNLYSQNAWINEFHYDNAGTDEGEFIEVVIQNPGDYFLPGFNVTLYNGSGGATYASYTLDQFSTISTIGNFTIYYFDFNVNGLQNGGPDGFSLDYQGTVLQFLSYEGSFMASDGPATGLISTDVGVSETSSTPVGFSLQLQGTGAYYSDFTWAGPIENTDGNVNTDQTLFEIVETPLSDWAVVLGVILIAVFAFFRFRRNG